jgi:hypothetical protein
VPHWLQRLAATVQQVRASRTAIAGLAENLLQVPRVPIALPDLEQQLTLAQGGQEELSLWAALIEALGDDE